MYRMKVINGIVGRTELGAVNQKDDVLRVQRMLKHVAKKFNRADLDPKSESGAINKDSKQSDTIKAMERFQKFIGRKPQGVFYPGGKSIRRLFTLAWDIAWGLKVDEEFKERLIEICLELGIRPGYLLSAIAFETGETFRADIRNPKSKAVGLIQFMAPTAKSLNTSQDSLAAMTPLQQLEYVRKYFLPYKGKLKTLEDVYLAIFTPAGIGKPGSHKLYKEGAKAYKQNSGFDKDGDGSITISEISVSVRTKHKKGKQKGNFG